MTSEWTMLLHVGQEVTFGEYLYRVLLYLVGFGGIALLVDSLVRMIDSLPFVTGRDTDEIER